MLPPGALNIVCGSSAGLLDALRTRDVAFERDLARDGIDLAVRYIGEAVAQYDSFTVTSAASLSQFTCSGLAQAAGYFTNGEVYFADGPYATLGAPLWVREHTAGGVINLAVPLYAGIAVAGQTGTIVAGCQKRKNEDCRDKFNNVLNFGGHKDLPSTEELVGQ